jgi:hypothetical protein
MDVEKQPLLKQTNDFQPRDAVSVTIDNTGKKIYSNFMLEIIPCISICEKGRRE